MRAVNVQVSEYLLLQLLRIHDKGVEIKKVDLNPIKAGVVNIVLTGENLPDVAEGHPYPNAIIECTPAKSEIKILPES